MKIIKMTHKTCFNCCFNNNSVGDNLNFKLKFNAREILAYMFNDVTCIVKYLILFKKKILQNTINHPLIYKLLNGNYF